jgi:cell division topological specificity factor
MGFFGRNKGSADAARNRLLSVLVSDRVKLTPDMLNRMKTELCEVIKRYVPNIDPEAIAISVTSTDNHMDQLETKIPIQRTRQ